MDLLQALPADAWLRWAVLIAMGLAVVSAILMVQVLLLSELAGRRQRRRAAFDRRWQPRLAAASLGGVPGDAASGGQAAAPARRDRAWFLMAWCQMQHRLRGEAHERLNRMLRELGLESMAVALLAHRNGSMQLLGLACLRHLADPAHWNAVASIVRDPRPIQSLAAAEGLVAMDPVRAMSMLVPMAADRRDWAVARVAMLWRLAGRDAVTRPLLDALQRPLRPGGRERLHGWLALGDPVALGPWARGVLGNDAQPHATAAALEVLGLARDPRDRDRLLARLDATGPAVRLAAVRALQGQATSMDLDRLAPLLADRDWAVRQAAADAIATLPGLDARALAALRERTTDRYGRDALDRAIAEHAP